MRNATWRTHVIRPGRACMSCNRQLDLGRVIPDKQGLLDNPDYINGADRPARPQGQNVAPLSVSVSGGLLAQYTSFSVAPAGFGDPGPAPVHAQHPRPAAPPLHHPAPLPDRTLRGRRRSPHTANRPPPAGRTKTTTGIVTRRTPPPSPLDRRRCPGHRQMVGPIMRIPHALVRMSSVLRGCGSGHTPWGRFCRIRRSFARTPKRQSAETPDGPCSRPSSSLKSTRHFWTPALIDNRAKTFTRRRSGYAPRPTRKCRGPGSDSAAWIPGCGYQRPFCTGYEAVHRLSRSGVAARRAAFAWISRSNTSRLRYHSLIDWEHQQPPQRGPQAAGPA